MSQRAPSPVLNQPLKSRLQTSFGASAAKSGPPGGVRRRRLRRAVSPPRARGQFPDRARRRPEPAGVSPLQRGLDLHRSPGRMLAAQVETGPDELGRHRPRVGPRRPRPLDEPGGAFRPPAPQPAVAGIAADPELPAERRERYLLGRPHQHETRPLLHRTALPPRHRQGPPRRHDDPSGMSSVRTVRDVAGLDLKSRLPRGGQARADLSTDKSAKCGGAVAPYTGQQGWMRAAGNNGHLDLPWHPHPARPRDRPPHMP